MVLQVWHHDGTICYKGGLQLGPFVVLVNKISVSDSKRTSKPLVFSTHISSNSIGDHYGCPSLPDVIALLYVNLG